MAASFDSQQCCIPTANDNNNNNNNNNKTEDREEEDYEKTYEKHRELVQALPRARGWRNEHVVQYNGCWLGPNNALKGVLLLQNHFKARPTDTILAAFMKCGTTWLRALIFATINRSRYDLSSHPLLNTGPHASFPVLDAYIYDNYPITNLEALPSPRLFAAHFPYALLKESMASTPSGCCKFVYIWRDPKDVLISKWYFMNRIKSKELPPLSLSEAFELFCQGISEYGPFWDHVLGYWKASLELPDKILFLKYEDLKREPSLYLKRLAEFMEAPFSAEEEDEGVVEQILELCSFEKLSSLEVNKTGVLRVSDQLVIHNRDFFRKGQIGDCKNYLTTEMIERLDSITQQKFNGTGLTFDG